MQSCKVYQEQAPTARCNAMEVYEDQAPNAKLQSRKVHEEQKTIAKLQGRQGVLGRGSHCPAAKLPNCVRRMVYHCNAVKTKTATNKLQRG